MARLKFKNGIVKDYTIILSTRDYGHLGQLTGLRAVNNVHNLNSANEMSFTICKHDFINADFNKEEELFDYETYLKLKQELWDQIVDLKLIYVKDIDEYFEIKVTITDAAETTKAITATSLCEAELSQTETGSIEINTEADIDRDDYYSDFPTVFYRNPKDIDMYSNVWEDKDKWELYCVYQTDEDGNIIKDGNDNKIIDEEMTYQKRYKILKESSLLHRVLDKVPHYSIGHIDESLKNLQRTFTIDGTIYNFLTGSCSEQFDCLFKFDSTKREISAYDLYTVCQECGERGEFYDQCPKCESTNIKYFGDDTTILVDKNNLTESIQLNVNVDSIKNCFKLVAGDDSMTAAIRSVNPNGSDYIYYFSENQLADMSDELVKRLKEYDELVESYEEESFQLANDKYNLLDEYYYLKHSMMPAIEYVDIYDELEDLENPHLGAIYLCENKVYRYDGSKFVEQNEKVEFYESLLPSSYHITSGTEAEKLTVENLSPLGLKDVNNYTSLSTVNSAIKNYASVYVKSGYVKVEINQSQFIDEVHTYTDEAGEWSCITWEGNFKITNYTDDEDIVITEPIQILVYNNYEEFVRQKILKNLPEDEEGSIFNVLQIEDIDEFTKAISLYCETRLESFKAAIDNAISVVQSMEQTIDYDAYYEALYVPYWNKLCKIASTCHNCNVQGDFLDICPSCGSTNITIGELARRKKQIEEIQSKIDVVDLRTNEIRKILDFEKYLDEYYNVFCAYRREQKYSNENYISDGYSNSEMLKDAQDFIEKAEKELIKSGELQYTLSSTLNNLLVLPEFEPIIDKFELGNWIRVKVDGVLYRLRLIGYTINFDNLQTINVEFSTISKIKDIAYEAQQILSSAKSMSSSYSYVSKQAEKGQEAKDNITDWKENNLNAALIQISNNDNEDVVFGNNGILCRLKDDISNTYSPKQLKLVHNTIAFTEDNWKTCSQAIGEHKYQIYDDKSNAWVDEIGYGMTANFVSAGTVTGSDIYGGLIHSLNYSNGTNGKSPVGTVIDLNEGTFSFAGGNLSWDGEKLAISSQSIEDVLSGENGLNVTADNLNVKANNIIGDIGSNQISSLESSKITGKLTSDQILSITASQIDVTNGKIQAEQINTIDISQVTGTIVADSANSVSASNITGTIASSKISNTLTNKTVSGEFSGEVTASAIDTTYNGKTYTGMTTNVVFGNQTLHFVNGLLVNVTTN